MKRPLRASSSSSIFSAVATILLTSVIYSAYAQTCNCDVVINPPATSSESSFIDGQTLGIKPGQTICLSAGFYKQIRFSNLSGEPGKPITIINCGGQVEIGSNENYGTWYAAEMVSCKYVRFTGTGDPAYTYGIKIGKSGDMGVKIGVFSTDTEIDHIDIGNTGFAGIMAKTDFGGKPPVDAPEMNNVNIHHNYIHDTLGEGLYIGETKTPGQNFRHLQIWNNVITRTGLDLAQVANAVEDVRVFNNVFYHGGTLNKLYQNKGFQIGDNSVGLYYNNLIVHSPSNPMIIMGSGNIDVFNNYIEGTVDPAFFVDNRAVTIPNAPINLYNNFITGVTEPSPFFSVYNEVNPIHITSNKLEGNNTVITFGSDAGPMVTLVGNTNEAIEHVQFTDIENNDFSLTPGSPHQDMGLLDEQEIAELNKQPYIAIIGDQEIDYGTVTEVSVSAKDPDNDAMILEAFDLPPFVSFQDQGGGTGMFSMAPGAGDVGVYYKVRVRVKDSDGGMNTQSFTIRVFGRYDFRASASSTDRLNYPANTLDHTFATRWAALNATGEWIKYDLREDKLVTDVKIAFYNGSVTKYTFGIEVSQDNANWVQVFAGENTGVTEEMETFTFSEIRARYVRIVDTGVGVNSYKEVQVMCTPAPQIHLFYPLDDVYADGSKVYNNELLKTYQSKRTAYLRYSVTGLDVSQAPVISARLRLKATESGYGKLLTWLGDHNDWTESAMLKSSLPRPLVLLSSVTTGFEVDQIYEMDVVSAVLDNGVYSFVLTFKNSDYGISFSSRSGIFSPELEVQTLRGATPLRDPIAREDNRYTLSRSNDDLRDETRLYPNPVGDQLTFDFGSDQSGLVAVEISDQLGKSIYRNAWTNAEQVDVDMQLLNIEPGTYFVKIKREGETPEVLRLIRK